LFNSSSWLGGITDIISSDSLAIAVRLGNKIYEILNYCSSAINYFQHYYKEYFQNCFCYTDGATNMTEKDAGFVTFYSDVLVVVPVHSIGNQEAMYNYTV
jgi:hypothetical protein